MTLEEILEQIGIKEELNHLDMLEESLNIFTEIRSTIESENHSKIKDHHYMKNVPTKHNEFLILFLLENGHVIESLISIRAEKVTIGLGVAIGIKHRTILK